MFSPKERVLDYNCTNFWNFYIFALDFCSVDISWVPRAVIQLEALLKNVLVLNLLMLTQAQGKDFDDNLFLNICQFILVMEESCRKIHHNFGKTKVNTSWFLSPTEYHCISQKIKYRLPYQESTRNVLMIWSKYYLMLKSSASILCNRAV